jgi:outer membrane protein assembly factor BamD (BamD/ComL family)
MRRFNCFVLFLVLTLFACNRQKNDEGKETHTAVQKADSNERHPKNYLSDCKKLYAEARRMDSILLTQTEVNNAVANKAIVAFTDFAYYCRTDSMRPIYLIKTAQVARAINNIPQAKLALDKCIEDHPSFNNRPAALFLLAQLYDEPTYLNDEHEARKLYQKIIDEHPKSDWAMSAKGAISLLGKSDEEIMKELKKKVKNNP